MKILAKILLSAAFLASAFVHTGCEVESAAGEVIVSPSSVALKKGSSAQFTASGGYEYRWHLEKEDWGMLSTRRGQSTVYTSLHDPRDGGATQTDPDVQILYAESYIPASLSSGAGTNNTPDVLQSGQAYITHISACEVDCEVEETTATTP